MEPNLAMTAIEETLRASDRSAARFASALVPVAAPGDRVGDVRRALVGRRFDSASAVAVCADEILIGLVRIEDLLAAEGDMTVEMVMDPKHAGDLARLGGFLHRTGDARATSEELLNPKASRG